jgi:ADP-ribosylglycohydrolase
VLEGADLQRLHVRTSPYYQDTDLAGFTPFGHVSRDEVDGVIQAATRRGIPAAASRAIGAFVGMAVGDTFGAPLEFLPAEDTPFRSTAGDGTSDRPGFRMIDQAYFGPNNKLLLEVGQWTDDTSMGLCLADSLLAHNGYNGSDARERYHAWWHHGYNTPFPPDGPHRRPSVGLGANIKQSLAALSMALDVASANIPVGTTTSRDTGAHQHSTSTSSKTPTSTTTVLPLLPPPAYKSDAADAGNGSIMRLAAIPVRFWRDPKLAASVAGRSSYATHPGPIAAACCEFLAWLIALTIGRDDGDGGGIADTTSPGITAAGTVAEWLDVAVDCYVAGFHNDGTPLPSASARKDGGVAKKGDPSKQNTAAASAEAEGQARLLLLRLLRAEAEPPQSTERCWNWRSPQLDIKQTLVNRGALYNEYQVSAGYFGSYAMDGLAVALHSVYTTDSFDAAVEKSINFLGDADSTASVAGQLAGAWYSYSAINTDARQKIQRWDPGRQIALRGALLFYSSSSDGATCFKPPNVI